MALYLFHQTDAEDITELEIIPLKSYCKSNTPGLSLPVTIKSGSHLSCK